MLLVIFGGSFGFSTNFIAANRRIGNHYKVAFWRNKTKRLDVVFSQSVPGYPVQITLTGDPLQFVGVLLAIAAAPELVVETELLFPLRGDGEGKEPPKELAFAELLVAQPPDVPLTLDVILPP